MPKPLRLKLQRAIRSFGWVANQFDHGFGRKEISSVANSYYATERGENTKDLLYHLDYCDNEDIPDILECFYLAIEYFGKKKSDTKGAAEQYSEVVNELLESYRVNYSLENGQVVGFESRDMHMAVVVPVLTLISKSGWESIEKSYQDALKEVANGDPTDAITDATTALQETFRKLGCKGDDFATLLKSAKTTILSGYDSKYIDAIASLVKWSSANRANRGDSHKVTAADKDDAWFVIHTVGILILRLSKSKK